MSPGGAATISAGASILDGAFGRSKGNPAKKSWQYQFKYGLPYANRQAEQDEFWRNRVIQGRVKDAKAAGLHPLFAMGAPSIGGGGSPSFSIPGQSERGSGISNAVTAAQKAYQGQALYTAQKDLVEAQAELSRARALEQVTSNDNAEEIMSRAPHGPDFNPKRQELKRGEYQVAGSDRHPEQNANVIRPMTTMKLGSQNIFIPMEELESFMEDPLAPSAAVLTYHGNRDVDWATVHQDWTKGGWKNLTKSEITAATKRMMKRSGLRPGRNRSKHIVVPNVRRRRM